MDVFVWRARLDIDLYGVGSRDRTAWETSFRPHLAEIFCGRIGSFRTALFRKTEVFSLLLLSTSSYFVDSWNTIVSLLGFLRQGVQHLVVIYNLLPDSWKTIVSYSRIPETDFNCGTSSWQQMPPKMLIVQTIVFATLVTGDIPINYLP